jgi:hypothetical protein
MIRFSRRRTPLSGEEVLRGKGAKPSLRSKGKIKGGDLGHFRKNYKELQGERVKGSRADEMANPI